MQGGLTAAQQQTLALKGLAAALHRGALVDGNTLSASFQAAHRCLHSTQVLSCCESQSSARLDELTSPRRCTDNVS